MLNFIESFFSIYWDDHMTFILQFVNMVYRIGWFVDIKKLLPLGINPTWWLYCWIWFANILLIIFASAEGLSEELHFRWNGMVKEWDNR